MANDSGAPSSASAKLRSLRVKASPMAVMTRPMSSGVYDIPNIECRTTSVLTNTAPGAIEFTRIR